MFRFAFIDLNNILPFGKINQSGLLHYYNSVICSILNMWLAVTWMDRVHNQIIVFSYHLPCHDILKVKQIGHAMGELLVCYGIHLMFYIGLYAVKI